MSDILIPAGMSEEQLKQAMQHGGRVDIPVQVPQKIIEAQKAMIHEGQLILAALKTLAGQYEYEGAKEAEGKSTEDPEYIKLRALMWLIKLNLPPEV